MKQRLTRAEKRERTREELVAAAGRLFTERGFHATSVDEIALEAGYTKGAVYSNFGSKEDLFFAVYERRAATMVGAIRRSVGEVGAEDALNALARDTTTRRGRDDGWLAVFFEFWAHVLRHPELRKRFAEIRRGYLRALEEALEAFGRERGGALPVDAADAVVAMNAAQIGIALERLTDPERVPVDLGERVSLLAFAALAERLDEEEEGI